MLTVINNSKDVIKNRMLKHALAYWDIKNTEDIDPAVKLIMEALSLELCNLGNEVKDTQVRILEKVANLLATDSLTSPDPAHAILHASPVEPTEILEKTTSFFAQRKVSSRQNEELDTVLDLYFTPVDAIQLHNVQITNIVTAGNLYSYSPGFMKQFLAKSNGPGTGHHTVWLGLKVHPGLDHLDNMVFCFDWKNLELKTDSRTLQLLPLSKWYVNGVELETKAGVQYVQPRRKKDKYQNIFQDYDLISLKEKDVRDLYNPRFITVSHVSGGHPSDIVGCYPKSFEGSFNQEDLAKLTEKLLWIKIVFPAGMQDDYLSELYVYPNSFPVMNRKVTDLKYRLKGGSNIIPLRTEMPDQFLCVKSLSDENREYRSVPYRTNDEEATGTYTLRNGGVERFDNRNAREQISYLLELLRSESAAFAAYGYDFIATTLKELNQKISLMEQKTKGYFNLGAEIPNYIIVKPLEGSEQMYAEYWTTLADAANNLRAGARLQQAKGAKVNQDSIMLMTTTIGGKNRLKPEEKLNAFRYGLMTRNRVITKEDIRNFCFYELGDSISEVTIEKGYDLSLGAKESFRKTINIIIRPAGGNSFDRQEWSIIADQLRSKLTARSGMMNNYMVIIK